MSDSRRWTKDLFDLIETLLEQSFGDPLGAQSLEVVKVFAAKEGVSADEVVVLLARVQADYKDRFELKREALKELEGYCKQFSFGQLLEAVSPELLKIVKGFTKRDDGSEGDKKARNGSGEKGD